MHVRAIPGRLRLGLAATSGTSSDPRSRTSLPGGMDESRRNRRAVVTTAEAAAGQDASAGAKGVIRFEIDTRVAGMKRRVSEARREARRDAGELATGGYHHRCRTHQPLQCGVLLLPAGRDAGAGTHAARRLRTVAGARGGIQGLARALSAPLEPRSRSAVPAAAGPCRAVQYVRRVRDARLACEMSTNGSLLSGDRALALLDAGLRVDQRQRLGPWPDYSVYGIPFAPTRDAWSDSSRSRGRCVVCIIVVVTAATRPTCARSKRTGGRAASIRLPEWPRQSRRQPAPRHRRVARTWPDDPGEVEPRLICLAPFFHLFTDGMDATTCARRIGGKRRWRSAASSRPRSPRSRPPSSPASAAASRLRALRDRSHEPAAPAPARRRPHRSSPLGASVEADLQRCRGAGWPAGRRCGIARIAGGVLKCSQRRQDVDAEHPGSSSVAPRPLGYLYLA